MVTVNLRLARRVMLSLALASPAGAAMARAQQPVGTLIAEARRHLDDLNADSAATLLRQVLERGSSATAAEHVRALVLFGITELSAGREQPARLLFRQALTLDYRLLVDSLAELHSDLLTVFNSVKEELRSVPSALEFTGLPPAARLVVDGRAWTLNRGTVSAGLHRFEITARGYEPLRDSVMVRPGAAVVREVQLAGAAMARLSVSSYPWSEVYIDGQLLGYTPVFSVAVPAGRYQLTLRSPVRRDSVVRSVILPQGKLTNLGTVGWGRPAGADPAGQARADSLFDAVALDSAAASYLATVRGSRNSDPRSSQEAAIVARAAMRAAMALHAVGRSLGDSSRLDSAVALFAEAHRTAPVYSPDSNEVDPEMRAALEAGRARVLLLDVALPADTLLPARGGRLRIVALASRASQVTLWISRGDPDAPPVYVDSQHTAGLAAFGWDVSTPTGSVVPSGRYALRFAASDAAGEMAPPIVRTFTVEREAFDTLPHPRPLAPSACAPETLRLRRAPAGVILAGLALGAGTLALKDALGNSELAAGGRLAAGSYVVAGSVSVVSIIGFLAGHRTRMLPDNIRRNADLRQRYVREREAAIAENVRRRENARVRIRFDGAP